MHARYGPGTVTAVEGAPADLLVSVQFEDGSVKRLSLKFARLQAS